MDKLAAKIYLTGKILELGKTLIYKTEIVAKGKLEQKNLSRCMKASGIN